MTNPPVQPVVLRHPRKKAAGTLALAVLMAGIAGFLVLVDGAGPLVRVVGGVGGVFFATCAVIALHALIRSKPVVILDPEAIEVRSSAFGRVRIPWDDVDHLVIGKVFGQRMLGIVPKDVEAWLATHSPAARVLLEANRAYGAPYWVAESTLPGTCEELASLMQRYRPVAVIQR